MNRPRILVLVLVSFAAMLLISAAPVSHVPKANTREAVMAYVKDAAAVVQKNGPSCTTFATSEWRSGDYYIFVSGPSGTTLCHPKPELVGKPTSAIVNASGDKVGERIAAASAGNGSGWVEYTWPRPGQTKEEPKSTYVMGVTGPDGKHYAVGSGGWGLSK